MSSFQIELDPRKRAAGRFIQAVRMALQQALEEEEGAGKTNKSAIADKLGIHRSAITRRLKGTENLTLRTLAEMAWALGRRPQFSLEKIPEKAGANEGFATADSVSPANTSRIVVGGMVASAVSISFSYNISKNVTSGEGVTVVIR